MKCFKCKRGFDLKGTVLWFSCDVRHPSLSNTLTDTLRHAHGAHFDKRRDPNNVIAQCREFKSLMWSEFGVLQLVFNTFKVGLAAKLCGGNNQLLYGKI